MSIDVTFIYKSVSDICNACTRRVHEIGLSGYIIYVFALQSKGSRNNGHADVVPFSVMMALHSCEDVDLDELHQTDVDHVIFDSIGKVDVENEMSSTSPVIDSMDTCPDNNLSTVLASENKLPLILASSIIATIDDISTEQKLSPISASNDITEMSSILASNVSEQDMSPIFASNDTADLATAMESIGNNHSHHHDLKHCIQCHLVESRLGQYRTCAQCHESDVVYCSVKCQRIHWHQYRLVCKPTQL